MLDAPIFAIALPRCAMCDRTIDRIVRTRSPESQQTLFAAYCHEAVQVVAVPDPMLLAAKQIEWATAFALDRPVLALVPENHVVDSLPRLQHSSGA